MKFTDYVPVSFVDEILEVTNSLSSVFVNYGSGVNFIHGNIIQHGPGSLVSPSNFYGNMDGGIDKVYADYFEDLESRVNNFIQEQHNGKLEFGSAQIVPTYNDSFPHIVMSPTIERPGDVSTVDNVYCATKAVLNETLRYNLKGHKSEQIQRLLIPGMGTGFGNLSPMDSARAVYNAFVDVDKKLDRF